MNTVYDSSPCCRLSRGALLITCSTSWQPICPNWVVGLISLNLFRSLLAILILITLADVSFRAIPRWLLGSWGSPLPLYIVRRMVVSQLAKSVLSSCQKFWMISAYKLRTYSGRFFIMSVVKPDWPSALSLAIVFMAEFISSMLGVSSKLIVVFYGGPENLPSA
jgi:hypothetical protein